MTDNNERIQLHQFTPGALLPLLVSLITALIVFAAVWLIAQIVFDALDPHKPAVLLASLSLLYMWITRMRLWTNLAQWERLTGLDLNHDGQIGEAKAQAEAEEEPRVSRVRIELSKIDNGHYSASSFDLPRGVTEEHLGQIAHDLFVLGRSFAETELSGTGRISLPKFRQLRAVMERQALCEKTGAASNAPFELTDAGEAWLKQYLPSPAPSEEGR